MNIFDTHCHLHYFSQTELISALSFCEKNQVTHVLSVSVKNNEAEEFFQKNKEIFNKFKINIYRSLGRHPLDSEIGYSYESIIQDFSSEIAIGETGFDFYHQGPSEKQQVENFLSHRAAAEYLKKPLIIHSRYAEEITLAHIQNIKCKFLIHCFTGSLDFAKKVLDLGGYISFSGVITYKNVGELQKVVDYCPTDRILVETDSPFLVPASFRKNYKNNQPGFIIETLNKISEIKEIDITLLKNQIFQNSCDLFL